MRGEINFLKKLGILIMLGVIALLPLSLCKVIPKEDAAIWGIFSLIAILILAAIDLSQKPKP